MLFVLPPDPHPKPQISGWSFHGTPLPSDLNFLKAPASPAKPEAPNSHRREFGSYLLSLVKEPSGGFHLRRANPGKEHFVGLRETHRKQLGRLRAILTTCSGPGLVFGVVKPRVPSSRSLGSKHKRGACANTKITQAGFKHCWDISLFLPSSWYVLCDAPTVKVK